VIGVIYAGQTTRTGTDGRLVPLLMHVIGAVTLMTVTVIVMTVTMMTMAVFMLVTVQMPMRSRIMIDGQFSDFVRMHERDDAHRQDCEDQ